VWLVCTTAASEVGGVTERERELEKTIASIESELRQRSHERTLVMARAAAFSAEEAALSLLALTLEHKTVHDDVRSLIERQHDTGRAMSIKAVY
jgi:hypothetical protein